MFLSHLDSDHINGFEILCEAFDGDIKEVVLPYLGSWDRLYLAAASMAEGTSSTSFRDFLISPVDWIESRIPGVRITQLNAPNDPNDGDNWVGPLFPIEPEGLTRDEAFYKQGAPQYRKTKSRLTRLDYFARQTVSERSTSSPLLLLACVPPREATRMSAFRRELRNTFPGALTDDRIKEILGNSGDRRVLRDCYMQLASDHNVLSIHLLAQPQGKLLVSGPYSRHGAYVTRTHVDGFSFLFSGDAKLSASRYFNHWKQFFKSYLDKVACFSLPHHGAARSFNNRLISALPNSKFIAQAGKNSYGHPAESIQRQLAGAHRWFWHVSEEGDSRLDWIVEISN
jgi:hypothetical protein